MPQISLLVDDLLPDEPSFIFLGGVHGVGKTTMCAQLFLPAGYHCMTASSLIHGYNQTADCDEKRVDSVADNQVKLLQQLQMEKQHHKRLLLDGHYCLRNTKLKVEPVDFDVFRKMRPDMLALLKDRPEAIKDRLALRDDSEWTTEFIAEFQQIEESHAQAIALELNIPLRILNFQDLKS